jgi:hypothetical protein
MSQEPSQESSSQAGRPGPQITDYMREQAKQNPNGWLYIVDPAYEDSGEEVPPEGVMGAYYIDANGEIDEEFHHNEQYQPSDLAFDLPEPTNELEQVLHQIATGAAPDSDLPPAVLGSDLLIYAPDDGELAIYAAEMSDGSRLVPACTSVSRVPESWPGYRTVPGRALPELLNGLDLGLNLDDGVRAVIPNSVLVETAAAQS